MTWFRHTRTKAVTLATGRNQVIEARQVGESVASTAVAPLHPHPMRQRLGPAAQMLPDQ